MILIDNVISVKELEKLASEMFGDLVKAVVDIEKELVVVQAELHADEEAFLLERGSKQQDLWGINLYPELYGTEDFIEFDSMINLRPSHGNNSRGVNDIKIQDKIREIIKKTVTK